MRKLKKIRLWLIKRFLGVKELRSPIDVLYQMIDEENKKPCTSEEGPDCSKIEAWEQAIVRISKECFTC